MAITERPAMKSGKALNNKVNPNYPTASLNLRYLIGIMS